MASAGISDSHISRRVTHHNNIHSNNNHNHNHNHNSNPPLSPYKNGASSRRVYPASSASPPRLDESVESTIKGHRTRSSSTASLSQRVEEYCQIVANFLSLSKHSNKRGPFVLSTSSSGVKKGLLQSPLFWIRMVACMLGVSLCLSMYSLFHYKQEDAASAAAGYVRTLTTEQMYAAYMHDATKQRRATKGRRQQQPPTSASLKSSRTHRQRQVLPIVLAEAWSTSTYRAIPHPPRMHKMDLSPDYNDITSQDERPAAIKLTEGRIIHKPYYEGYFYHHDEEKQLEQQRNEWYKKSKSAHLGHYYAFDDDYRKGLNDVTGHHTCRRNQFHRLYNPTCNEFHAMDLVNGRGRYSSHGHFRVVWKQYLPTSTPDHLQPFALKMLRRGKSHEFDHDFYEMTRNDALVMQLLTSSPRIVNIYGHCAASVVSERMVEEVEMYVVPGSGYITQAELDDKEDVRPRNNFTPTEKLSMALEMAEALADVHGFEKGVIVHDDVQLCQFLKNEEGVMKLNDFNRAEVMLWDESAGKYCRYRNGKVYGNYRAPEEDADDPLNEQIDVYSMGNNIYALLTGLWVYYENEDDQVVQGMVKEGQWPFVDPRYRTRSYAEGALVKILERCWQFSPDERATIFEVVDFLRHAKAENARLMAEKAAGGVEKEEDRIVNNGGKKDKRKRKLDVK